MTRPIDVYRELGDTLDMRLDARDGYIRSVVTKGRILDIGGRNQTSASAGRLRGYGATEIVATDIVATYDPDLVDDITATTIEPESFDGVYCDAVLEHVTDYWTAIDNIHRILRPGGEAFIYVPFFWWFHDQMDYHRFTITEVARMVRQFREAKVFVPGGGGRGGWGYVMLMVLTYGTITRNGRLHRRLAAAANGLLGAAIRVRCRLRPTECTTEQVVFFGTHLAYNHGFCAWVRK